MCCKWTKITKETVFTQTAAGGAYNHHIFMKHALLFVLLWLYIAIGHAQTYIPGHTVGGNRHFVTSIKNTSKQSATFFPRGTDVRAPYRHYSDSVRLTYLMAQIPRQLSHKRGVDSAKVRLAILLAGIDMVKDYHRVNKAFFINEMHTDNIFMAFTQQHAGGLCQTAVYSQQCSNAWRELVILLIQTKWFDKSMFRTINLQGAHDLGEVFIKSWILVDADAGMPVAVSKDRSSPIGYASFNAVRADTALINERFMSRIYNGTRVDAVHWYSLSEYRGLFANPAYNVVTDSTLWWLEAAMTKSNTTEIILPAGAEITVEYNSPWYMLDTASPAGRQTFACMNYNDSMYDKTYDRKYIQAGIDTLFGYMGKPIPLDSFIIIDAIKNPPYSLQYVPTARVSIPAQAQDTRLKLPWLITELDATAAVYYNYTIVQCESYKLWHSSNNVFTTHSDIHYADSVIIPAGVALEMELAFNPTYFDWWRGFVADPLGEPDALEIKLNGITVEAVEPKVLPVRK